MPSRQLRAPNGAGTIYQRKDGRYEASARVLMPNGGRRRVSVYGTTRDEVRRKLTALLSRSDNGIPEADRSWTLEEWLDYWMRNVVSVRNRPRTIEAYEGIIRRHLKPYLGSARLKLLTVADVQAVINTLARNGTGARTIQQVRGVLSAALSRAEREEYVHRNVARLVDLPKYQPKEIHPWDLDEARVFLDAVRGHQWEIGFYLLLVYGVRRGEALGLRWGDIDLKRGSIQIRQQLQRIDGKVVAGDVKTSAGRRTLPLLPELRQLIEALAATRNIDITDTAVADELILTSSTGQPVEPCNFARTFHLIVEKTGLRRITVHQTRHTAATLLKTAGVQARDVQLILGHSNVSTTQQLYQHGMFDEQRNALQGVANALKSSDPSARENEAAHQHELGRDSTNGRQRRPFDYSDTINNVDSQATSANEKRHLTEVEMADFLGGSGGTRTHDILLKSSILASLGDLPASVIDELHTRTRQRFWGALAVRMTVKSGLPAYPAEHHESPLTILRALPFRQLRSYTYPFSLTPSTPPITKELT